ncbi:hypothetical protein III_05284 [Bacillus mycoides]|uniref:Uncharacterized protein n=1 Tax=Bacillus mycoides TaxID=1405 RepID=A0ABC9QWB7_BACMY|nr:hypothetical protein III_05284 [Bacillus mycoides]
MIPIMAAAELNKVIHFKPTVLKSNLPVQLYLKDGWGASLLLLKLFQYTKEVITTISDIAFIYVKASKIKSDTPYFI